MLDKVRNIVLIQIPPDMWDGMQACSQGYLCIWGGVGGLQPTLELFKVIQWRNLYRRASYNASLFVYFPYLQNRASKKTRAQVNV